MTAIVHDGLNALALESSQPVIYDRPIGLRLLHRDPVSGDEHYVIRYPAGLGALQHRHTAAQTIVVLSGELVADGRTVGPGGYCHFPARSLHHHVPACGGPCLFVTIFHGPFDVEPSPHAHRSPVQPRASSRPGTRRAPG